jgi:hypothetical protein
MISSVSSVEKIFPIFIFSFSFLEVCLFISQCDIESLSLSIGIYRNKKTSSTDYLFSLFILFFFGALLRSSGVVGAPCVSETLSAGDP